MRFVRKVRGFAALPRFVQVWLVPAYVLLGLSRLAVLTVPFRHLAPHLGQHLGVASWVPLSDAAQQHRARRIGQVVRLAAAYAPWDANCLAQAITARVLLRLHGVPYALFFGVRFEGEGRRDLHAHAWVASGPVPVTGGSGFSDYAVTSVFATPVSGDPVQQRPTRI